MTYISEISRLQKTSKLCEARDGERGGLGRGGVEGGEDKGVVSRICV